MSGLLSYEKSVKSEWTFFVREHYMQRMLMPRDSHDPKGQDILQRKFSIIDFGITKLFFYKDDTGVSTEFDLNDHQWPFLIGVSLIEYVRLYR